MPVREVSVPKSADWRVKQATSLRSKYKLGELQEQNIDPMVWRLFKYFDDSADPLIKSAMTLHNSHSYVAQDIVSSFVTNTPVAVIAAKYDLDEELLEVFRQLYADPVFIGPPESRLCQYSQNLAPAQRQRFNLQRRYGAHYNVLSEGAKALPADFSTKDIIEMVKHAMSQSYMVATRGGDVSLDAPEQKTIIAYNNIFMQLVRLLQDLEANSTNVNVILERLATYTKKIPNKAAVVPAMAELLKNTNNGENFQLAPAEDCA